MQKTSYMGNGYKTEFDFNFPFYNDSDIIVLKNNQNASDYTIVGTPGGLNADFPYIYGKVVFNVAPSETDTITIYREIPLNRVVDYQPTEKINTTILNQDMNYMLAVLKDMNDKLETFDEQYHDIVNKESTQNVLSKISHIDELIDNDEFINKYISNCITKIPQDINLYIDSSYNLVLNAGSNVYTGDGIKITTANNITYPAAAGQPSIKFLILINTTGTALNITSLSTAVSAATNPGGTYRAWFNTSDGKCYWNDGSANGVEYCLPIAIVTHTNGTGWTHIDQIFNGFGYIGSTIFTLPGITGLIPNGRNANGTIKNIITTIKTIKTASASNSKYLISDSGISPASNANYAEQEDQPNFTDGEWYNPTENIMYNISNGIVSKTQKLYAFDVYTESGKITKLKHKYPFSAVDYNN